MPKHPIYVICDNVRSLYNVGAIFRSSDAANIKKLYLCGITGCPKDDLNWFQTKRIEKTALGSTQTVVWEYIKNTVDIIKKLKSKGIKIYALENLPNAKLYNSTHYDFPCALVLGHEAKGVSQEVLDLVDEVIQIPMYGAKNSLNVEAAYAIAVYEVLKQIEK